MNKLQKKNITVSFILFSKFSYKVYFIEIINICAFH